MEDEVTGGWKIFKYKNGRTERRFIPLGVRKRRPRHCKSCLYFRKGSNTCVLNPNKLVFCDPESEACEYYVNRTHKNS